jgi:hypothetical protein
MSLLSKGKDFKFQNASFDIFYSFPTVKKLNLRCTAVKGGAKLERCRPLPYLFAAFGNAASTLKSRLPSSYFFIFCSTPNHRERERALQHSRLNRVSYSLL